MYFTKVELHNFGIYRGTHEMYLTNQVGERNITLVGGLNGRGKTTFHDAILIALYGKQALKYIQEKVRSYDKLLLDHINKHAVPQEAYVAVSLCLEDGTNLRVKRSWVAKAKRVDQQISVEKNGTIDKYLGESWSYYIEEILPFGIARFFFFNNEKIAQLADDVSFEQIKSSIKSAIGVSTIEKTIQHTEELIRRKKKDLAAFEKSEDYIGYREVEAELQAIDREIEETTRRKHELEKRCEVIAATLEAKENEFWTSGGDLNRNRDAIEQEKRKISENAEKTREEIDRLVMDASTPLFLCKNLVVQSYNNEITVQKKAAARYSNQLMTGLFHEITDRLNNSTLDQTVIQSAQEIIRGVFLDYLPAGDAEEYIQNVSAATMTLYEHMIADIFQLLALRIHKLINQINEQENELMSLDAHLGTEDEKDLAMQLFETLKEIEREKAGVDAEYQRQHEALENLIRKREILKGKRTQLIKAIAEKESTNDDDARIIKYAAMSIQVLMEFKVRLQCEKVDQLSSMATTCFKELVGKRSLISKIFIDAKTLDVHILDLEGNELLKNQLSAGEQQMFAVAIIWALALSSGYKAPVIIDTPMARLDSSHRINFVTKYLPAASSQVVVLSTDEEISGNYLDLIRNHVIEYYTLLYSEEEQYTSIVPGYFEEV